MRKTMLEHMKERFGDENEYGLEPNLPASLNIELNNTCNHKCIFCEFHSPYSEYAKNAKLKVMKLDYVYKILEQAWNLGIGRKEVGFYATGEVFLYKDFADVIKYAKGLGFSYTFVTTNGALATPDKMKAVIDAGLDSIRFSVNAGERKTYEEMHGRDDFDTVVENIKFLRSYLDENNININTSVSYVVTKENIGQISKAKEIFSGLVDEILFIPVIGLHLWNTQLDRRLSLDEYVERDAVENKNLRCPVIFNTMYIDSDCKVRICCETVTKELEAFDLKQEMDLEKAWHSSVYKFYREAMCKKDLKGTLCENCHQLRQGVTRAIMGE